ncbi:MAG: hypothetical protein Q9207_000597 [Kuettlingeria erythrocarpa]
MDLPLISSFVQNSIDAALAEYVAPKSLTLDMKDMLLGDDFKKDTSAHGVLVVRIISATGFKQGDLGISGFGTGSSDGYVAVGWAKFGKPLWSTRIIRDDMEPCWEETAFLLVGPNELNAEERLCVQLWDSDRTSADDDLGKVEVALKELMSDSGSFSQMKQRSDGFQTLSRSEEMPGQLNWAVGYFPKTRIQDEQLEQQSLEPDVKSMQQLKRLVARDVRRKMRETLSRSEVTEFGQQEAQDLKIREDSMIAATPPLHEFPTGILSLQIHQISGLEFERINKPRDEDESPDGAAAGSDDLPSSYCTVFLNHQKIFKTRTKPKSSEPFFNAGTERFIRDMYRDKAVEGQLHWHSRKGRIVRLAVQRRYRSSLVIEFRKSRLGLDGTPAFAILWLQDIPDEQENEQSIRVPVFSGSKANLQRGQSNYTCDLGEQLGSVAVTAAFRRGLGPYHQRLAKKDTSIRDMLGQ